MVRARICDDLHFLGIELDRRRNGANEPVLSKTGNKTIVRMIHTGEELMIARYVQEIVTKDYT